MSVPTNHSDGAFVEVINCRRWSQDARLGRFRVFVDGKAVGWANAYGSLKVPVASGAHTVRIRGTYWFSPRVRVDIAAGETIRLAANTVTDHSLALFAHLMIHPLSGFDLKLLAPGEDVHLPKINTDLIAKKRHATQVFSAAMVLAILLFAIANQNGNRTASISFEIVSIVMGLGTFVWFLITWQRSSRR
jgi:hypothetical protein